MKILKYCIVLAAAAACCLEAGEPAGEKVRQFVFDEELAAEDPAVTQWRLGNTALQHRLYANAEKHFLEYRRLVAGVSADYARGTARLVETYIHWNKYSEAKSRLLELSALKIVGLPLETEAELVYLGGYLEFQEKNWQKTLDIYDPMLNPFVMTSFTERMVLIASDCYAHLKAWKKMTWLLERYLPNLKKDTPNDFQIRLRLVRGYAAQNNYPAAHRFLDSITGKVPEEDRQEFDIYRCLVFTGLKKYPEAVKIHQDLEKRTPAGVRMSLWSRMSADLAKLAVEQKDLDFAEKLYQEALQIRSNPDRKTHVIELAGLKISRRKDAEAIALLQKWRLDFPKEPEYPRVTMMLGQVMARTANWLQAAELFAEAMNSSALPIQDRLQSAILRADSLEKGGYFADAAQAYLQVGKLTGKDKNATARACNRAAEVFIKAGRRESAAAIYKQVADLYGTQTEGRNARYNQALTLLELQKYDDARKAFRQFLTEQPDHPQVWEGRLKYAAAWRAVAADDKEREELVQYALDIGEKCPAEMLSLQGYFTAYEIAEENGLLTRATEILRRVTERYPKSSLVHLAIYKGIALLFRSGKYDLALQQSELFLNRFARTSRAPDVYMLLGDYYQSLRKFREAISCYGKIRSPEYDSPLIPEAQFEMAGCHLNLNEPAEARKILTALIPGEDSQKKFSDEMLARLELQLGEAYAMENKRELARQHFALARNYAQDQELGLVALARQGEMLIEMATVNPVLWDKAVECFSLILNSNFKVPALLWEKVRFQLAKCYEGKGDRKQALFQYQELYLEYLADKQAGRNRSWKYYYLSILEMTGILENFGDDESMRRAARLYEELSRTNLPRAAEAAAKAALIRKNFALGKGNK